MKNIVREVVAVSKTVILVGIIIVAGLVTATAYIFLSRPDSPRILDSDSSVSGIIFPEEGGAIETTGIDGNHFKLEIPKDALIEPNGENISITPFTEKENIPLTGDLIAGVMLEPDGLQLYKTATLTIELTNSMPANEVVGFTICENEFHLIPIETNGKTLTFQLIHFSPYGAATGSPSDCATLPEPTSEAKAKQKISCILFNAGNDPDNIGESDRLQIIDAMLTWYSSSIEPNLNNALTDDNLLKPAINEFLAWHFFAVENVEWILQEMPDEIAMCKDDGWSLVDLCIDNAFNRYEQKCSSSLDLAEKKENLNKLSWIEKLIGILEFGERALVRTNVHVFEELCNGAFLQPDSISISPTSATLEIGESESLKATAKNVLGDVIDDRHLVLTWANSNEDAVVLLGSSSIVSVTGKEEGHATITVTAGNTFDPNKVVSAKSEITVTSEEKQEEPEPTIPDEGEEKPVLKYSIYWKATQNNIHTCEHIREWDIEGYDRVARVDWIIYARETRSYFYNRTGFFEGYAEIETIPQHLWLKENKTMLVTDLSVDLCFDRHEKIITDTNFTECEYYQATDHREYHCEGHRQVLRDTGIEYIKNELERTFGDFRFSAMPNTISFFHVTFGRFGEGLFDVRGAADNNYYDGDTPSNPFYCGDCSDPNWKIEWTQGRNGKLAYWGDPGYVDFDEKTQTFHKEIDFHLSDIVHKDEPDVPIYVHWEIEVIPLNDPTDTSVASLMDIHTDSSIYRDIDVDNAYNLITCSTNSNVVVLDVRTQSEFDSGYISGAVWIPVTELEARIGELAAHKNQEIIVYCGSGGRSVTASEILQSHGFIKVINMVGGISAWQSAGYTLNLEVISSSFPLWTQWWFWATKLSGTIVLIGVVYLLKKRKPPMPKIHSLIKSYAKHQNTHSEIRNDTINQQEIGNLTIGEFREK